MYQVNAFFLLWQIRHYLYFFFWYVIVLITVCNVLHFSFSSVFNFLFSGCCLIHLGLFLLCLISWRLPLGPAFPSLSMILFPFFLFAYLFSNIPVCLLGPLLFWLRTLENHECLRHHCHQHITKSGSESLLNWLKIWYERCSSDRFPIRSDTMHAPAKICILDENQQMKPFKFCQGCHFCSRVWNPFQNVIEMSEDYRL